jgi:hypothetical protein
MYPAQALFDEFYTVDDLPDEIIYKNPFGEPLTLFKGIGTTPISPAIPGAFFGRPEPEFEGAFVYYAEDSYNEGWRKGADLDFPPGPCLIAEENGYEGQFADTYTVTWDAFGEGSPNTNVVVTRESLCVWRGSDPCGNLVLLFYGFNSEASGGQDYQWSVKANVYVESCDNLDLSRSTQKAQGEFQNSPVGFYSGIYNLTVS